MQCSHCGATLEASALTCPTCGNAVGAAAGAQRSARSTVAPAAEFGGPGPRGDAERIYVPVRPIAPETTATETSPEMTFLRTPPAAANRRRWRLFSHRPVGYANGAWWLIAGITRDWRGIAAAIVAAWFNLPIAILLAVALTVGGGIAGVIAGVGAASNVEDVPVFGEVLQQISFRAGAGLGALLGISVGLLSGGIAGFVLPWVEILGDPFVGLLVVTLNVLFALVVGVLYTLYGVIFEPVRLRLAGARRLSRREAEYLLPLLHECADQLGLRNVPRLLIDDGQDVNALAYTRHIVVHRGLLTFMKYDRDAVAGVLAHELTHWHNADGVSRLLVRGVALPLYLVHAAVTWALRFDNPIVRFFASIIGWPVLISVRYFVVPMQAATARTAEFRADQGAVRAGYRDGIRSVLERLQRSFDGSRNGWDSAICASHPPNEHRLERLERRGQEYPLVPSKLERT
jgi:Zn-dependent protease with chaperone function